MYPDPVKNKKLSAVLVGGSNSLMKPGYLTELSSALLKHDIDLKLTANLAVGNTTSLLGLMHIKLRPELIRETDVLLIEYTLNDTATYAASLGAMQLWVRAVEGIIRFARAENPSIKIACFLFATKVGMHRETINPLYAGMHYLAHYYQMAIADVNAAFVRRFGRDFYDLPGAYGDYAHYQRPVFTRLAAEVIAEEIAPHLKDDRALLALPPAIDPNNHEGAGVIRSQEIEDAPTEQFTNSIADEVCADLCAGSLILHMRRGGLLALKYVCTPDCAPLYVKRGGGWTSYRTMQSGVEEGKYKFLIFNITFDFEEASEGSSMITLTGRKPKGVEIVTGPHSPRKSATHPERRLPVSALMYNGSLSRMRWVPATRKAPLVPNLVEPESQNPESQNPGPMDPGASEV